MTYLPALYRRPARDTWRTRRTSPSPITPPQPARPASTETVRVLPGMGPGSVLVTGYTAAGTPLIRMEMPARWLTPQWIRWLESRIALEDVPSPQSLKLLG